MATVSLSWLTFMAAEASYELLLDELFIINYESY